MTSTIKLLENQLASARHPEEQLKIINQLSAALRESDPVRALALSKKAVELCKDPLLSINVPSEDMIFCHLQSGELCLDNGLYLSALEQLLTLEALLPEQTGAETYSRLYPNIAQTYQQLEMPEKALHYLEKTLALNSIEGPTRQAIFMCYLGEAYFNTGAYARGLIYLNKGLKLSEELEAHHIQISILENLSKTSFYQQNIEQALEYASKARELAKNNSKDKQCEIITWEAMLHENLDNNTQAAACYQEALSIAQAEELYERVIETLYHHASLNLKIGSPDLCISQLQQALKQAENAAWEDDLEKLHKTLSEAYHRMGNHKEALFHFQQFHNHNERKRQAKFETQLKVEQIEQRTKALKREKQILSSPAIQQNRAPEHPPTDTVIGKTAVSDPLTGLYNRRYFLSEAEKKLGEAVPLGQQLSIILINVDHFEQINELHGRLLGDQVLFFIADRICSTLRETDTSARFGGDEFIILLPDSSKQQTGNAAQRLLREVGNHPFFIERETIRVTLSIGISCLKSGENISLNKLLSRAKNAMQQAKQNGRNQICYYCD